MNQDWTHFVWWRHNHACEINPIHTTVKKLISNAQKWFKKWHFWKILVHSWDSSSSELFRSCLIRFDLVYSGYSRFTNEKTGKNLKVFKFFKSKILKVWSPMKYIRLYVLINSSNWIYLNKTDQIKIIHDNSRDFTPWLILYPLRPFELAKIGLQFSCVGIFYRYNSFPCFGLT